MGICKHCISQYTAFSTHQRSERAEALFGNSLWQFQKENENLAAPLFHSSRISDSPEAVVAIRVHQSSSGDSIYR